MSDTQPPSDEIEAALREAEETGLAFSVGQDPERIQAERAGDRIDRYELLHELGEGGMGTVWAAQQSVPVERAVALKIIKLGMDTREVVVRFEAERQALALMDHPYIAKVLDGGATEAGRPYFVMELVSGLPITEFCDQQRLGLRERLELFTKVCEALQHAHQKGVIHRDVKPSNVLVAAQEGISTPRVIDFGIAKATSAELTKKTLFTRHAQVIGTPEYMAPEQAGLAEHDVDTRADVYSLGVLLYELLTGTKPFDVHTALEAGYEELLRTIREVDPAKPSTRVSTMGDEATPIAQTRHVNVESLSKRLRGDLDWIVMKALEKDRERRYDSASAFAEDVSRYLRDESVLAAPPSAAYRLRKFVRRRRGLVVAASLLLLTLLLGGTGTGVGWWRSVRANERLGIAMEERGEALELEQQQRALAVENEERAELAAQRAMEVNAVVRGMLSLVSPWYAQGGDTGLVEGMFDELGARIESGSIEDPYVEAELRAILGQLETGLGRLDSAEGHLTRALDLFGEHETLRGHGVELDLGRLRYSQGRVSEARELLESGLAVFEANEGWDSSEARSARALLAVIALDEGRVSEAIELQQAVHEHLVAELGERSPSTLVAQLELARMLSNGARRAEAGPMIESAFAICLEDLGEEHPLTADAMLRSADELRQVGELRMAHERAQRAIELLDMHFDGEGARLSSGYEVLGAIYLQQADFVGAEAPLRRSIELLDAVTGEPRALSAETRSKLANALQAQGRVEEALELAQQACALEVDERGYESAESLTALAHCLRAVGRNHEGIELVRGGMQRQPLEEIAPLDRSSLLSLLGNLHRELGEVEPAVEAWTSALEIQQRVDPEGLNILAASANLGLALNELGRHEEALRWIEPSLARMRAELPPEHPWLMNNLGNAASAYAGLGRDEEALAVRRESLELIVAAAEADDAHPEAMHRAAHTLWSAEGELQDLERAYALAERMLAHPQAHGFMHVTMGNIQYDLGELEEAIASMERGLELLDPRASQYGAIQEVVRQFRAELEP